MKKKPLVLVYALFLIIVLFTVASYYLVNQGNSGKRTNLVGDGLCGNFVNEVNQDSCCAQAHEDDITDACVGKWEYASALERCQFVCEGNLLACPEDARICSDGETTVVRNASLDCEFDACP